MRAEAVSKHNLVKGKQTNEGFIFFPPLDSNVPAPLLCCISIVLVQCKIIIYFFCVSLKVCKFLSTSLKSSPTVRYPIKTVQPDLIEGLSLSTATKSTTWGVVKHLLLAVGGLPYRDSKIPLDDILYVGFITLWASNTSHG